MNNNESSVVNPNQYSATEQPSPVHNDYPAIWDLVLIDLPELFGKYLENDLLDLVVRDITDRDQMGLQKYGTRLQPNNGRSAITDLYQECMDAVVYARQALYEANEGPNSGSEMAELYQVLLGAVIGLRHLIREKTKT